MQQDRKETTMIEPYRWGLAPASMSLLLAACSVGGGGSHSPLTVTVPPAHVARHNVACADLTTEWKSSMQDLRLTRATEVAATATVPAYCDVRGTIKGNVK